MSDVVIVYRDGTTQAAEFILAAACENALRRKAAAIKATRCRDRDLEGYRGRNAERMRRRRAARKAVVQ